MPVRTPPLVLGHAEYPCPWCGTTRHMFYLTLRNWATTPCLCEASCTECTLSEPVSLHEAGAWLLGLAA